MLIPHDPAAKRCYEDLKNIRVFGPGIERLIEVAKSQQTFGSRLTTLQKLRDELVDEFRALPASRDSIGQQDMFVCAADDVMEAMFDEETTKLSELPPDARAARGEVLAKLVRSITLDPRWNAYTREQIAADIEKASKK
jgi:hypothetical protein